MERNDGTERGNGTARHAHVLKMQWWDFSNVVEIVVEIYIIYIYIQPATYLVTTSSNVLIPCSPRWTFCFGEF